VTADLPRALAQNLRQTGFRTKEFQIMRIAVSSSDGLRVCGHAGKARRWRVRDADGGERDLNLTREQLFHFWEGEAGSHPLEAVDFVVTGSAGEGFVQRLEKQGVKVLVTGEKRVDRIFDSLLAGGELPPPPFDPLLLVCKLHDLFGRR
jgi:predicted Fe-Mo cluster-binding NifX family protein